MDADNRDQIVPAPQKPQTAARNDARSRFCFLLGSIAVFYVLPLCLPPAKVADGQPRFIEISSVGGQLFLAAFWSMVLGWLCLLMRQRAATLVLGGFAFVAAATIPLATDIPSDRGHWTWLVACAILIAGGYRLPKRQKTV